MYVFIYIYVHVHISLHFIILCESQTTTCDVIISSCYIVFFFDFTPLCEIKRNMFPENRVTAYIPVKGITVWGEKLVFLV